VVGLHQGIHTFLRTDLWLAAGWLFSLSPGSGWKHGYAGYAILGVILINGMFSFWQQFRAERAIAALRKLLPQYVKALRTAKSA